VSNPFWFNIIQQWKKMGKGEYGVTFPFLAGAVALDSKGEATEELISSIFEEMKKNPIPGHYCEVRWCGNINEPVVSISPIEHAKKVALKAEHKNNGTISVGFTSDLMDCFHLDCKTFDECLEKLIKRTCETVQKVHFSKNNGVFTPFSQSDIEFIDAVQKST
jgi:hypothetical protein